MTLFGAIIDVVLVDLIKILISCVLLIVVFYPEVLLFDNG
jgi:hypothetical protein